MDTREAIEQRIGEAYAAVDAATNDLIRLELEEDFRPGIELDVELGKLRLAKAIEDLVLPQGQLDDLDAEIARAQVSADSWETQLDDPIAEDRINARLNFREWEEELSRLRVKREQSSQALEVFTRERDAAKDALAQAWIIHDGFIANLEAPNAGWGRKTQAYRIWRVMMGRLVPFLIAVGDDFPEADVMMDLMDLLSEAGHYSTDNLHARLLAQTQAQTRENFARTPEKAPSGADIVSELHTTLGNQKLGKESRETKTLIENRVIAAPTTRTESFRQVPGR